MQKSNFLDKIAALYRCGNRSDHDDKMKNAADETWTKPEMAGVACCYHLDQMLHALVECGVITKEEHRYFYDNL